MAEKFYKLYAGLGGSFGGAKYDRTGAFASEEDANTVAWELACEEYERYAGMYGLRSISNIMKEDGVSEEDATETYNEERETWLAYNVKEAAGPDDTEDE